ncbi:MAG: hypothetical protein JOZ41_16265 [Chloroflexi bacterium]|nr:hypothetical protein [Chloroflexota bacterium]
MKLSAVALAVALVSALVPGSTRAAQTAVQYAPGWNLVGGPPGTDLSSAEALFVYRTGAYATAGGTATTVCQGYWAYFPAPTVVTLAPAADATQTCTLQAGWTMVGNPLDQPAALPPSLDAAAWDPISGRYVRPTAIPPGGAIWVYSSGASTLTFQPGKQGQFAQIDGRTSGSL